MRRYSVALYGLGRIAWRGFNKPGIETHAAEITKHPRLRLVAGIDIDRQARLDFQAAYGVLVHDEPVKADIAVICTPPEYHAPCVAKALALGAKAILCEKPLAPTFTEAMAIELWCDEARIPLLVGHQRRYDPEHRRLRDKQPDGLSVMFSGTWLNNGTHAVDIARFLSRKPPLIIRADFQCFTILASWPDGIASLSSYGYLAPGYLRRMYDDLIECIETGKTPECSGKDGTEAVRIALEEEAKCPQETGNSIPATACRSLTEARSVSASNASWSEPTASRTPGC